MPDSAQDDTKAAAGAERRDEAWRAIVALGIASLQLTATLPLVARGHGMPPSLVTPEGHPGFGWVMMVGSLAVLVLGRGIFVDAWAAVRQRTAGLSTLIALGSGAAFLSSAMVLVAPARFVTEGRLPDRHFDAASLLVAFALLGRALEGRGGGASGNAVRSGGARVADRGSANLSLGVVLAGAAAAAAMLGPEPTLAHAFAVFAAVVVVGCPAALALAAPTAIATALGRAAELGMNARSADALERAAEVDTVVLDETGARAEGDPELVRFVVLATRDAAAQDEELAREEAGAKAEADAEIDARADALLRLAAAVERGSEHPVGRAIVSEAEDRGLEVPAATDLALAASASAGATSGARARVEGKDVRVGAAAWLATEGVQGTEGLPPEAAFGVAVDGALRGFGVVADHVRDDASDAIARLRALDVRVVVLGRARAADARALVSTLGVEELEVASGPDGTRDALARLAAEGRRVAVCGAPDSAALDDLPDTLALARRTAQVARQNVALASVFNLALVPVAAGALVSSLGLRMSPWFAAGALLLSSASVVVSSRRLRRFELGAAPAAPAAPPAAPEDGASSERAPAG
jgi:cation transport ATPase